MKIVITENQLKRIINDQVEKTGCQQLFSVDIINKSKEYWKNWLNNSVTIEKISRNNNVSVDIVKNEYIPKWMGVIDGIQIKFDNIKKDSFAYSQGNIIHINCDMEISKDETPFDILVHEIQHQLYNVMSMNPKSMINKVSRVSGNNKTALMNIINAFDLTGYDENKLMKLKSYWEKNGDKGYVYDQDEIMSRIGSIRGKYGIVPGGSIDPKVFKDEFLGKYDNSDMGFIICLWARNGYPDFKSFINGLDSLAMGKNNNKNKLV